MTARRMGLRNPITRALIGVWVGALGIAVAACYDEGAIPASGDVTLPACDNEIGGMTQNISRDGVRTAFLQADRACLWENSDTLVVEAFRLTVYAEGTGVEEAVVTGDRGVLNLASQQMRANGNAILFIPAQGRRLESGELYYDPQANRIFSDSATIMYHEGRVVEGAGFSSDLEFQNVSVRQARTRPGGAAPPPTSPPLPGGTRTPGGNPEGTPEGEVTPLPDTAGIGQDP